VDEGVEALKVAEPGVRGFVATFSRVTRKARITLPRTRVIWVNKGRFWPIYGIRSSPMNATGASGHLQSARK
jgi:hypothetical protein